MGSGIEVEERGGETWIFTVQDGRVVRVNEFATREEALEAAGVRDSASTALDEIH
jgi:ketosteroid isomerase-like protein